MQLGSRRTDVLSSTPWKVTELSCRPSLVERILSLSAGTWSWWPSLNSPGTTIGKDSLKTCALTFSQVQRGQLGHLGVNTRDFLSVSPNMLKERSKRVALQEFPQLQSLSFRNHEISFFI